MFCRAPFSKLLNKLLIFCIAEFGIISQRMSVSYHFVGFSFNENGVEMKNKRFHCTYSTPFNFLLLIVATLFS